MTSSQMEGTTSIYLQAHMTTPGLIVMVPVFPSEASGKSGLISNFLCRTLHLASAIIHNYFIG